MNSALRNVVVFTLVLLGLYVLLGEVVTNISGGGGPVAAEGINPEAGEAIFWGKGKCSTCHSVGDRGSTIRCPNLGESGPLALPIGMRAAERVGERQAQGATHIQTATDYLVESVAFPSAYVVEGFKDEMPEAYLPPISLTPDEIRAVVTYLQSQGGEVDASAIQLPPEVMAAAGRQEAASPWQPYMQGDPEAGRALFFDLEGKAPCAKCHMVNGEGGQVGPELTDVAGTRPPQYIIESIVSPSTEIASGYESVLLQTADGRTIDGVMREETDEAILLVTKEGEELTIPQEDISRRRDDVPSIMPDNFSDILTVKELHDLLAFLEQAAGVLEEGEPEARGVAPALSVAARSHPRGRLQSLFDFMRDTVPGHAAVPLGAVVCRASG